MTATELLNELDEFMQSHAVEIFEYSIKEFATVDEIEIGDRKVKEGLNENHQDKRTGKKRKSNCTKCFRSDETMP